jgi:lipopolysaccharide export system permease protein
MTIVDRYLSAVFLKTFLVCFLSTAGLFTVVHLFSNLDELNEIAKKVGWSVVFTEFYLPRVAEIYDKSAAIMTLIAAVFAVSLLQRRREMTAIEAAGLTKQRILRPIFILAAILIGLTIANREILIPKFKQQLARTPQSWGEAGHTKMSIYTDPNNISVRGERFYLADHRVANIEIELPNNMVTAATPPLRAQSGFLREKTDWSPAGFLLDKVTSNIASVKPLPTKDKKEQFVFLPHETNWLAQDQIFVRCEFTPDEIAYGDKIVSYRSTSEMVIAAAKPKRWFTRGQYVGIHSRLVRPILDFTLLLLGLPLVIGGIERNVFMSAARCFAIVGIIQLVSLVCYSLGASSLIRPAALAVWTPILIFAPAAMIAMRGLKR